MKRIIVKDSEWYREAYNMPNRVHVYVGETKAEYQIRVAKDKFNRVNGHSGYDEIHEEVLDEVRG